jgi:transposase
MLADETDFVIGVDTHRDRHAAAIVTATGGVLAELELAASQPGYRDVLARVRRHAPGRRVWAMEGTGSYGAGLARFLLAQGERVVEIDRPTRREGRSGAKSDALDAVRAAREALGRSRLAAPRADGQRAGLRALVTTREGAVLARTAAINQLRALIVVAPEPLRAELRALPYARLIERCAQLRPSSRSEQSRPAVLALRSCARRIRALQQETRDLKRAIRQLVRELAPGLLDEPGVGPISAAQLLIAWSHPQRFRSEAAFAMLAGSSPIPASSGQTIRHRLNRGGDRQLNRALHTIVLARRTTHAPTRAYFARRLSEGKTSREAARCLKRYIARRLYRVLETSAKTHQTTIGPGGAQP